MTPDDRILAAELVLGLLPDDERARAEARRGCPTRRCCNTARRQRDVQIRSIRRDARHRQAIGRRPTNARLPFDVQRLRRPSKHTPRRLDQSPAGLRVRRRIPTAELHGRADHAALPHGRDIGAWTAHDVLDQSFLHQTDLAPYRRDQARSR